MANPSSDHRPPRLDELEPRSRRRLVVRTGLLSVGWLITIVAVYYVEPWDGGGGAAVVVRIVVSLLVLIGITAWAVVDIVRSPFPALRAVPFLAIVVGFAVVSFASVYLLVSRDDPLAFSEALGRTDALYFSVTTATTVGYGDIHAKSDVARIVVMLHMVTNVVVIGIAARLIVRAARRPDGLR